MKCVEDDDGEKIFAHNIQLLTHFSLLFLLDYYVVADNARTNNKTDRTSCRNDLYCNLIE